MFTKRRFLLVFLETGVTKDESVLIREFGTFTEIQNSFAPSLLNMNVRSLPWKAPECTGVQFITSWKGKWRCFASVGNGLSDRLL